MSNPDEIVRREEQPGKGRAEYGSSLVRELFKHPGNELGKGFSVANLKNFRQFFLAFPDLGKGYALRSELTWTHYRLIMRVENNKAREWYIAEAADPRRRSRQLELNINIFHARIFARRSQSDGD